MLGCRRQLVLALVAAACTGEGDSPTSSDDDTSAETSGGTTATGNSSDPTAPTSNATDSASEGGTATEAGPDDSGSDGASSTSDGALACMDGSDCRLLDDCCTCEALHVDEDVPPSCDLACERTMCQLWNTGVFCSHTCLLRLVDCDPALIQCADDPPECGEGFQPAIEERCWTQQCVPVELCNPY